MVSSIRRLLQNNDWGVCRSHHFQQTNSSEFHRQFDKETTSHGEERLNLHLSHEGYVLQFCICAQVVISFEVMGSDTPFSNWELSGRFSTKYDAIAINAACMFFKFSFWQLGLHFLRISRTPSPTSILSNVRRFSCFVRSTFINDLVLNLPLAPIIASFLTNLSIVPLTRNFNLWWIRWTIGPSVWNIVKYFWNNGAMFFKNAICIFVSFSFFKAVWIRWYLWFFGRCLLYSS